MPTPLLQLSPATYQHPADHAALNTLRSIPGFSEIVRKFASWFGERSARHLFTANSVRVGPTLYPEVDALLTEVLTTLDWAERPQLFIRQSGDVAAYAVGFENPFIVINSSMLELLDRDELRFVIAHEVGHIMTGRTTYRTIALIILMVGMSGLPFLAGLALFPFQMALLEWYRKAELSADRAALLGTQDVRVAQMTFFKMAGGGRAGANVDLDAFLAHAREYPIDGGAWDKVLKVVNTAFRDHPFATVRAAELQKWVDDGHYSRILGGDYVRRGSEQEAPFKSDDKGTADHYSAKAREAVSSVTDAVSRARDAFTEAFKGKTGT